MKVVHHKHYKKSSQSDLKCFESVSENAQLKLEKFEPISKFSLVLINSGLGKTRSIFSSILNVNNVKHEEITENFP